MFNNSIPPLRFFEDNFSSSSPFAMSLPIFERYVLRARFPFGIIKKYCFVLKCEHKTYLVSKVAYHFWPYNWWDFFSIFQKLTNRSQSMLAKQSPSRRTDNCSQMSSKRRRHGSGDTTSAPQKRRRPNPQEDTNSGRRTGDTNTTAAVKVQLEMTGWFVS